MRAYEVVGVKSLMCGWRLEGIEYSNVRMDSVPLAVCVKTEKSAWRSSFALATGTDKDNQSPAAEAAENPMPLSDNHWVTAAVVSSDGRAKDSTYIPISMVKESWMEEKMYLLL
jgi:hypothetical protein